MKNSFLPTNKKELSHRGWKTCDIVLITGDAYVDHPSFGVPMIGRYLESLGYKVGIIAQPDWKSDEDFLKLGLPNLFVGISAGNIDSMLAHYTANIKLRRDDDYTPGNIHGKRPNRAVIVYTNKIKQLMPGIPVVIGGLEASMRRLAHYDYWSDTIRRSILLDSKADILVYGMGENPIKEIACRLQNKKNLDNIAGTVISQTKKEFDLELFPDSIMLPSCNELIEDKEKLLDMTVILENNLNPYNAKVLIQEHKDQYVINNPPAMPLDTEEIDSLYSLKFTGKPHYSYSEKIPAYEMIKDSITILRGCAGGCSFCSIGLHQGKIIQSRSEKSILNQIESLCKRDDFKGTISDIGGPTANLYKLGCKDVKSLKNCKKPSCLFPEICKNFNCNSKDLIKLMKKARNLPEIKNIFITSGVRFDVALQNPEYIEELIKHHVSGQLKIAPESFNNSILKLMRKPEHKYFVEFLKIFQKVSTKNKKKLYILPYLISSFPGCSNSDAHKDAQYLKSNKIKIEQIQNFIPLPMTCAAAMYYTELDINTREKIFVAKTAKDRKQQNKTLLWWKK